MGHNILRVFFFYCHNEEGTTVKEREVIGKDGIISTVLLDYPTWQNITLHSLAVSNVFVQINA